MRIAVRALIQNSYSQMLLVQHHGSSFWSLPGGKVEAKEDLKTALQREIFEELGVDCQVHELLLVQEFRYTDQSDVTVEFFFTVSLYTEDINTLQGEYTDKELTKIEWISVSEDTDIKPEVLKTYCQNSSHFSVPYFSFV